MTETKTISPLARETCEGLTVLMENETGHRERVCVHNENATDPVFERDRQECKACVRIQSALDRVVDQAKAAASEVRGSGSTAAAAVRAIESLLGKQEK